MPPARIDGFGRVDFAGLGDDILYFAMGYFQFFDLAKDEFTSVFTDRMSKRLNEIFW